MICLERSPEIRLIDLAATMHWGQPAYPFRVGVVASCTIDLCRKLRRLIELMDVPGCNSIHDPEGLYWSDPTQDARAVSHSISKGFGKPNEKQVSTLSPLVADRDDSTTATIPFPCAREWLQHEVASRFGHGMAVDLHLFPMDRQARLLDLHGPLNRSTAKTSRQETPQERRLLLYEAIQLMDQILVHEHEIALELLRA